MTRAASALEISIPVPESGLAPETAGIVGHIAHELRQPLSTIESIAYYLGLVLQTEQPKVRRQLEKLQQLVEQSNWIVSNAVYLTQAATPAPERVDLNEIVSVSLAGAPCVELCLAEFLPLVWLDPGQAQHLVRNLIHFFRGAAGPDRPIVVATSFTAGEVSLDLTCASAGCCESTESGLTLASVRRVVESHNGRLRIAPDSIHVGLPNFELRVSAGA
ncbi:MAG: hypothetical protein ABI165_13425 [Bryobacteraceae bacterium]